MRPLVGRAAELERIASLLGGEGMAAAIVVGEPGVGKSRLLDEAARLLEEPAFRVIGYESERPVPLAAASELLRELTSVPLHGTLLNEIAFGASPAGGPVRVFEAAHRAMDSIGDALMVVDDVQWLDDLSVALIHYLLRGSAASGATLRLLAAGRNVDRSLLFAEEIERLLPPPQSEVIDLEPLDPEESLELALSLDPDLDREEAALLGKRSAGLPFWIETLVRSGEAVADTVRLLTGRLRGAGPDPAALLALLAVAARPLSVEDAAELLSWPPERAEGATDSLVSRGLASRKGGEVRIAHDLLREAAFSQLSEGRRRDLDRRFAEWLEQTGGGEVSTLREALVHRLAAGETPTELAGKLVSSPRRRLLGRDALPALVVVADETDAQDPEGQALHVGLAELAFELGDHRLALERWSAVAAAAAEQDIRFDALLGASKAAFGLGWEYAQRSHDLVEEALACATGEAQRVEARAHEARLLLWLDHDTPGGAAAARDALERSRRLGRHGPERRVRLDALHAARDVAMQENDGEQMSRVADEMLAIVGEGEDAYVAALIVRSDGEARTRPLREAVESGRAALALARRRFLPLETVEAGLMLACRLHDQGQLDEATEVAREAEELATRAEYVRPTRLIGRELGLVRGDCELERGLRAYETEVERRPDPHVRIWPRQIAAILLSRGSGPRAAGEVAALLATAKQDAAAAACPRCTNVVHVASAEALARVGRIDEAERDLREAEAVEPRDALNRMLRSHARGLVTAGNDAAAGGAMLEQACFEAELLDRGLELLWARIDLARVLASEERQRATDMLRDIAARADSIQAALIREVAELELRRLGVRTWRRGLSATAGELTTRERQVAQHVARGASNPEIAQSLFLSRKTVERHVSNVLAKLGARNRAELAAMLARDVGNLR